MADQTIIYAEETAQQTTTNNTWTDVNATDLKAAIASSNFTPGQDYFIFVTALISNNDGIGADMQVRLVHGSTPAEFTGSFMQIIPKTTTSKYSYGFFVKWTAVSGEDVRLQYRNLSSTGDICQADQITITALHLDSEMEFKYDENDTSTALTTTHADFATTGNFTTAGDGEEWAVFAMAVIGTPSSSRRAVSRINAAGTVISTLPEIQQEELNGASVLNQCMFRPYVLNSTDTQVFKVQCAEASSSSMTHEHSRIFALNLTKFNKKAVEYTEAFVSADTNNNLATTPVQAQTKGITPAVVGKVWVVAAANTDTASASSTDQIKVRLQFDNADAPPTQTSDNYLTYRHWDGNDNLPFLMQTVQDAVSAALHTADIDISSDSASNMLGRRALMLVSMELAGGSPPAAVNASSHAMVVG